MTRQRVVLWGGPGDGQVMHLHGPRDRLYWPLPLDLALVRADTRMDVLEQHWAIYELHRGPGGELAYRYTGHDQ